MNATTQDHDAYVESNQGWNFVVNALDLSFYTLAMSFIYSSTVISLYAGHLTSSAALIGLIPAVQAAGHYFPQLLMSRSAERLTRMKPLVQKISVMERLPYLLVVLNIVLWPSAPAWVSFGVLAASLTLATVAGGLASPAWQGMLAKVIRTERRGLLFGVSQAMGGLLGIGGAALSRSILTNYAYPTSFACVFLLCFVFQVLSWISLSLNREPAKAPTKAPESSRDYWRRLPHVLRTNPNFARYLVSRAFVILGSMATAFYVLYARDAFKITEGFAAGLTMAALVSQTLSTPLLGYLGDRFGHKSVSVLSTLFGLGAIVLVLLARSPQWFYAVYACMSASSSGMMVANLGLTMEFSAQEDIPTFVALSATLLAGPILVAPVLAGWLIDIAGYHTLFVTALVLMALGLMGIGLVVREPRHLKPVRQSAP